VRDLGRIFLRGFALVGLVAFNTRLVATSRLPEAFLTATLLSWVWWGNSKTAAHSQARYARVAYAVGAGLGTACSIWLG
jgi:hypothetical protein